LTASALFLSEPGVKRAFNIFNVSD